ncbi:hypothetical protein L484_002301 [Morus notabilis]|uniref:Uncharacterized protein n=1 Tax=Morus notabilis TaxID=981085 RepID=W9R037_9ROSA|nr:hypothetical protein L484_002301 [Morus notabilis]
MGDDRKFDHDNRLHMVSIVRMCGLGKTSRAFQLLFLGFHISAVGFNVKKSMDKMKKDQKELLGKIKKGAALRALEEHRLIDFFV